MYTVQIQRYSINTTFPAALQARPQGFMNTTFYLHLQQNSSEKTYYHSHKGHVVRVKKKTSNTWVFLKYNFAPKNIEIVTGTAVGKYKYPNSNSGKQFYQKQSMRRNTSSDTLVLRHWHRLSTFLLLRNIFPSASLDPCLHVLTHFKMSIFTNYCGARRAAWNEIFKACRLKNLTFTFGRLPKVI